MKGSVFTKIQIENLYRSSSNKDLARYLGIHPNTLLNYIKELGITPKGKGKGCSKKRKKLNIIQG